MRLKGKVALVTGASKGIGKAVSEGFAKEGADLYLVGHQDRDGLNEAMETCKSLGANVGGGLFDVGNYEEVKTLVQNAENIFGTVDVLVNNAGIIQPTPFLEISPLQWDRVIKTHLYGTFYCTSEIVKRFMKEKQRGKIINVCAPAALRGSIGVADYASAKGGIYAFTKNVARELLIHSIQVNAILPVAKSRMTDALADFYGTEGGRLLHLPDPKELIPSFVFFASADSDYVTGQILTADGGMMC
ncbi:MAG: SDR family NAD(P)-dependent oxidoreductase [Syntrophorhabdales bacterium]|jgi:3-oxoacyl-[acyl-carrier protein] reductase